MTLLIDKIVDNYHIKEEIGKGGMGVVYKAYHTTLKRPVALKMIHPMYAEDETFLKRFRGEARAQAKLVHDNIVTLHDFRETEYGWLIVMSYIDGIDLSKKIHETGPIPLPEALDMMKQLLRGLEYAHQCNVVHYDIKPHNIILDRQGVVRLGDFGLARAYERSGETTITEGSASTTNKGGTLYYMSPEQITGVKDIDYRADIYSMGMTFYEILAGRRPFEKNESGWSIQNRIVEGSIPALSDEYKNIPEEISDIVMQALRRDREERFQSAGAMYQELKKYEKGQNTYLGRKNNVTPEVKKNSSKTIPVIIGGSLVVILLVLGYFFYGELFLAEQERAIDDALGKIAILVTPEEAQIKLNGKLRSTSELSNFIVAPDSYRIEISHPNYESIDRFIVVNKGWNKTRLFKMKKLESTLSEPNSHEDLPVERIVLKTGKIYFSKIYSGASIWLDDKKISGEMPLELVSVRTGVHTLVIRKDGYEVYRTAIDVMEDEIVKLNTPLVPLKGRLDLESYPSGKVWVDGKLYAPRMKERHWIDLLPGEHLIKVQTSSGQRWEKKIQIKAEQTSDIKIDFEEKIKVVITAEAMEGEKGVGWGEIFVDGKSRGYFPQELKLTVGIHILEIRRSGYIAIPDKKIIRLENDDKPITVSFQLAKK